PAPPLLPFEDRELRASREIQSALLPREVPFVQGYHLEVEYQPCGALSGDFYDFHVYEDGRILLTLGDVSGKGPAGAMVMAMVQTLFRENAEVAAGPADLLRRVNDGFAGTLGKGVFVTALAALLDPEAHRLTLGGAGHHPLLLLNPGERRTTQVAARGLALGLVSGDGFAPSLTETTIDIAPGDSLLLYTDGASESVEQAIESRFLAAAAGAVIHGPHGALRRLREDLWDGAPARRDDATLLLVARLGGARSERMMSDRIPRDATV
ncbi:MAG: PP2C family protein-serine/threonine phosphatase, partial [Planctomycetota bacterium]